MSVKIILTCDVDSVTTFTALTAITAIARDQAAAQGWIQREDAFRDVCPTCALRFAGDGRPQPRQAAS